MNVRPLPTEVTAALLRAMQVIDFARPPWPILPDEEEWWLDVLHDARAQRPTEKRLGESSRWAYLRLDRHRSPVIKLACQRCGLSEQFDTEEVMRTFGPDYNMGLLRHKLVRCPHQKMRDAVFAPCNLITMSSRPADCCAPLSCNPLGTTMLKAVIVALLLLGLGTPGKATSANTILQSCEAVLRDVKPTDDGKFAVPREALHCWHYFEAFTDVAYLLRDSGVPYLGICAPELTQATEFIRIFVEHVKRNPQQLNLRAAGIAVSVLSVAFPCAQKLPTQRPR